MRSTWIVLTITGILVAGAGFGAVAAARAIQDSAATNWIGTTTHGFGAGHGHSRNHHNQDRHRQRDMSIRERDEFDSASGKNSCNHDRERHSRMHAATHHRNHGACPFGNLPN